MQDSSHLPAKTTLRDYFNCFYSGSDVANFAFRKEINPWKIRQPGKRNYDHFNPLFRWFVFFFFCLAALQRTPRFAGGTRPERCSVVSAEKRGSEKKERKI